MVYWLVCLFVGYWLTLINRTFSHCNYEYYPPRQINCQMLLLFNSPSSEVLRVIRFITMSTGSAYIPTLQMIM